MIVENMLSVSCMNAGMGDPPSLFYTNVLESTNAVIKRAINFEQSEMCDFALKMVQLMKQQKEDIRGALLNSGPYKLTGKYTHLQLTKEKWFAMTIEQCTAYKMAFDKSCLNEVTNKGIPEEALSSPSLNTEEANLTHLPLQLVKRVFSKEQSLLLKEDAIVQAPGSKGMAFMVESKTSR